MSKLTPPIHCLLVALLVIAVGYSLALGQKESSNALSVTLKTDRLKYRVGEKIKFDVALLNSGDSPIYLYGYLSWGYSSSFTLHVMNATGREIQAKELDDSLTPPPPSDDRGAFIKLNPEHFFGTTRVASLDELNINRPGRYKIKVGYQSPIPNSFSQGLPIWSREEGWLESNIVEIEVIRR